MKESAIQAHIIQYMTMRGHYVMRLNSGLVKSERGGMMRLAPAGTPDLLCIKDGKCLFIEVKAGKNKPTDLQLQMMAILESYGAKCLVSYGIDDLQERGL